MATLTTSHTLILLKNPKPFSPTNLLRNPQFLRPLKTLNPKFTLKIQSSKLQTLKTLNSPSPNPILTGATRTITTIFALSFALLKTLIHKSQQPIAAVSANSLFFAAMGGGGGMSNWTLNKPLTVVAAGLSKWLDIFSAVLIVRVLLSWFPNVPWDKQPMPAIRGLCDPYLNLFRNIIPPVFSTLDISPLLAFAILGVVGSLLKGGQGGF